MLQSCPALIIKKPVNSHTCNCAPPYKSPACVDVTKYSSKWEKLHVRGKTDFTKKKKISSDNRTYKTTAENEAHIRTVALFMHFCTCYLAILAQM